jgi:hypothetical protein
MNQLQIEIDALTARIEQNRIYFGERRAALVAEQ